MKQIHKSYFIPLKTIAWSNCKFHLFCRTNYFFIQFKYSSKGPQIRRDDNDLYCYFYFGTLYSDVNNYRILINISVLRVCQYSKASLMTISDDNHIC
jgi:hypothetical protein